MFSLYIESLSYAITKLIGAFAYITTVFWWEIFKSLEYDSEFTIFPEDSIFVFYKWLFCNDIHKSGKYTRFERVKLFDHDSGKEDICISS